MYTLAQEIIFPQKLQKDLAKLDKKCFYCVLKNLLANLATVLIGIMHKETARKT